MDVNSLVNRIETGLIAVVLVLLGQTSNNTVDLTPIVGLMTSILPLIMTILMLVMIMKLFTGLIDSFGKVFQVKFMRFKVRLFNYLTPVVSAVVFIAQTTTTDLTDTITLTTSLISVILPLIMTVLVLSIVFKLIGRLTDSLRF